MPARRQIFPIRSTASRARKLFTIPKITCDGYYHKNSATNPSEIELMKPGQVLISALQLSTFKAESLHALMNKELQRFVLSICVMKAAH